MTGKEQFEHLGDGLLVRAPAKINLSLLIAGKRDDGFHEIQTVMARVDLFDQILIQPGQTSSIELIVTGPHWSPPSQENLIYQAADMLLKNCDKQANLKITLTKNIPAGSGLGSASSDAAATLVGLQRFLQLAITPQQLAEMAAALGSDVPFFLDGPLALCTGKGEKIKKLNEIFDFSALLVLPDINVSTRKVYANYTHDLALYETLSSQINSHIEKNRIDLVSAMCANMLQTSCFSLYKELAELKAEIESLGVGPLQLSGSGSAFVCIAGREGKQRLEEYGNMVSEKIGCKSIIVDNNRW